MSKDENVILGCLGLVVLAPVVIYVIFRPVMTVLVGYVVTLFM